jgi:hypothetical protein
MHHIFLIEKNYISYRTKRALVDITISLSFSVKRVLLENKFLNKNKNYQLRT